MPALDQELVGLAATHDIIKVGMLADDVRRRHHGLTTTFVRVADVAASMGAPVSIPAAAGEVRIVGAPATRMAAVERVREVAAAAGRVPGAALSAYSLSDLEQLAASESVTLRALLEDLRAAGLELVAEAPVDRLRDARRSIEEVNIAGLVLARLTVDQSSSADPLTFLKSVAELQRAVGVLRVFAPLPRRINPAVPTTGYDDVKRVALARIVIDAVPSIQVDWTRYGPKLAQVALTMGADDVDAVSADDDGSNEGRRRSALEEIRRNIHAAGQEPVERNGRFDVVTR
jgi:aminodeoxyfutalosine synthase